MNWWQYLMLVNVYLLLFYGFYALLLSRETFFQLNRIYLVAAALLSFFIPLIQSDWVRRLFITQKVQYTIYSSPVMLFRFKPVQDQYITLGQVFVVIYLAGIVFLLARFIWQLIVLKRVIDQPGTSEAYSFFKKVKLGDDHENHDVIAAHEDVHARQWHSADVLIIEAVMIINWFNPVVYLYRFAIKHIHEFIADRQALKSGTDRADYALLLLSQTFNTPAHQLVNPFFNKSLLKQRIIMLQKSRSHRVALFKYCLSAPLFGLMLILSSATVNNSKTFRIIRIKTQQVFLKPVAGETSDIATYVTKLNGTTTVREVDRGPGKKRLVLVTIKDTVPVKSGLIFTSVEQVPEFPGGIQAFSNFLSGNIKYPAGSRKKGIQGKVIITFIVETDGSLAGIHIARGVANDIDQEALRVLKLSPRWKPGIQNGRAVRVAYSVPISFALDDLKPAKPAENKTGAVIEDKKALGTSIVLNEDPKPASDTSKNIVEIRLKDSASPLYLLDGKEISNINGLNPNDIESISVFKDKQATAIYGPKGAFGVVIITTKKNRIKSNPLKL
jgi:TonB family protein